MNIDLHGHVVVLEILRTGTHQESWRPVITRQVNGWQMVSNDRFVNGRDKLADYYLINLLGNPIETTRSIADVVSMGLLEAFPKLKLCFVHAGGTLPYVRGRFEHGYNVRTEPKLRIQRPPSEYIKLLRRRQATGGCAPGHLCQGAGRHDPPAGALPDHLAHGDRGGQWPRRCSACCRARGPATRSIHRYWAPEARDLTPRPPSLQGKGGSEGRGGAREGGWSKVKKAYLEESWQ